MNSWHDLFVSIDRELYSSVDRNGMRIMHILHSSPDEYCSYKTLSIASSMTHDQLSKSLQVLTEKDFITKTADPKDKRVTLYRLEEKGRQLILSCDALIQNEIFEFFRRNIIRPNQVSERAADNRGLTTK